MVRAPEANAGINQPVFCGSQPIFTNLKTTLKQHSEQIQVFFGLPQKFQEIPDDPGVSNTSEKIHFPPTKPERGSVGSPGVIPDGEIHAARSRMGCCRNRVTSIPIGVLRIWQDLKSEAAAREFICPCV